MYMKRDSMSDKPYFVEKYLNFYTLTIFDTEYLNYSIDY